MGRGPALTKTSKAPTLNKLYVDCTPRIVIVKNREIPFRIWNRHAHETPPGEATHGGGPRVDETQATHPFTFDIHTNSQLSLVGVATPLLELPLSFAVLSSLVAIKGDHTAHGPAHAPSARFRACASVGCASARPPRPRCRWCRQGRRRGGLSAPRWQRWRAVGRAHGVCVGRVRPSS